MVAILGPTAVGKSWLAMQLAAHLDGEIVSADALQAYRGFDIGTAKPTIEDQRQVPHHLVDIRDPQETYSAGEFARAASRVIREIFARGRLPLLVGGSGLYLRALLEGISPIPETSPEIRAGLRRRLETEGLEVLRSELMERDPVTAERLRPGDTQRTLRALEVVLSTGRCLSSWLAENPSGRGSPESVRVGLTLPRDVLYDRISERVRRMVGAGWVEEVENLLGQGLSPELPAFQAIGYRQLAAHLRGESGLEEALTAIEKATRRYAKRQQTWFRRERAVSWFSMEDPPECLSSVMQHLQDQGIGGGNGQA